MEGNPHLNRSDIQGPPALHLEITLESKHSSFDIIGTAAFNREDMLVAGLI